MKNTDQVKAGKEHPSGQRAESLVSQEQGLQPTERPWHVLNDGSLGSIVDAKGNAVAQAQARIGDYRHETRKANAELIVRAVNSHDNLIAALLPIAKAYPDDPGTSDLYDEQPVRICLGDVRRAWSALHQAGVEWK